MPPPAGDFIRAQLQRVAGEPLPRQHQTAGFAVADHADDRGARIGLEGRTHLADHILTRIEDKHPCAGELGLRYEGDNLGAHKH